VQAINVIGASNISLPSDNLVAAVVPNAPGQPLYLTSTRTQIAFYWTAPAFNGGSQITGYKIIWA